jgi:hypothetical protein
LAQWARERGLEDDLVQLALLHLARVDSRFDPARATSPHRCRMAILAARVSDCFDLLMRARRRRRKARRPPRQRTGEKKRTDGAHMRRRGEGLELIDR